MTNFGNTLFGNYVAKPFLRTFQGLFCYMQNVRQEEQNEFNMGLANARVPPSWSVERDRAYPLRMYIQDLELWAAATDMDEDRQGPAAALRLTGAARAIIREMPVQMLVQGQNIQQGGAPVHINGLQCLVRALQRRYGALDQEQQIFAVSELMQFSRLSHESADEVLARFDVIVARAEQVAGVAFPPVIKAWMTLTFLRVPKTSWPLLLAPTLGLLPIDDAQYIAMIQYVRRNSHLFESQGDRQKTMQHPFYAEQSHDAPAFAFFSGQEESYSEHANSVWSPVTTTWSYPTNPVAYDDDNISWHSWSTGKSATDDNDLTWTDLPNDPNEHAEYLYLNYHFHKRRFRKFAFKRRRFFGNKGSKGSHGKGSGKGYRKGKGKGKGKGKYHNSSLGTAGSGAPGFWVDGATDWNEQPAYWTDESYDWGNESWDQGTTDMTYFGGKGKVKGQGSGKGNPYGKDGRQMTCSGCGSTEHFWKQCTNKGKGKGGKASTFVTLDPQPSYASSSTPSQPSNSIASVQSSSRANFVFLTAAEPVSEQPQSTIVFRDGSPSITLFSEQGQRSQHDDNTSVRSLFAINEDESVNVFDQARLQHMFPVWTQESENDTHYTYHNRVRLQTGEALLVDTGCIDAIAGSEFVERVSALAHNAGRGSDYKPLRTHLQIEGVGSGSSTCTRECYLPIAMEDGLSSVHRTKEVPQSNLPGLVGLEVMDRRRVLLDIVHNKFIEVGPGGFTLSLSPGSRVLPMKRAPTGHLMLPCTEWNKVVKADKHAYFQE